jgi:hypothetical protein
MSLADIVSDAIAATERNSTIVTHAAVEYAFPIVRNDDEATDQCIREALGKRIKDVATRRDRKPPGSDSETEPLLFDLRPRHALDTDGRTIKTTRAMTQLEFTRVREIRRQTIINDEGYLKQLDEAAAALAPIWDLYPDLTFGEAEDLYRRQRGAA